MKLSKVSVAVAMAVAFAAPFSFAGAVNAGAINAQTASSEIEESTTMNGACSPWAYFLGMCEF